MFGQFSALWIKGFHCLKGVVRIRSYSGLHFPAFGLSENADQNNSEYEHFSRSVKCISLNTPRVELTKNKGTKLNQTKN